MGLALSRNSDISIQFIHSGLGSSFDVRIKCPHITKRRPNMFYKQKDKSRWFTYILTVLIIIGVFIVPTRYSQAADIVTNDYFLNHKSIEPFYGQYKLDPHVVIHVREVVLAGRERTAPLQGKVLLFLHGYSVPGYIAFDLNYKDCSMMRYFALAGWDTLALDYEGHGLSSCPAVMDLPSAFPEAKAPIHSNVAINDVERVFSFISNLRGVNKIYVLGWSLGASRTAPIYTIRHQDTVAKLVLFAPGYKSLGFADGMRKQADFFETKMRVIVSHPEVSGFYRFGSRKDILVPGVFEAFRDAMLAADPKSGELGGSYRITAGRFSDLLRNNPEFDASKITVPTLVIRGAFDTFSTREDCQALTNDLGSQVKKFVEIPNASHMIPYEKANTTFYKAVRDFLEAKVKAEKKK
jgi:pimeloyl-ACP methyl ester carboxylesterase